MIAISGIMRETHDHVIAATQTIERLIAEPAIPFGQAATLNQAINHLYAASAALLRVNAELDGLGVQLYMIDNPTVEVPGANSASR